MNIKKVLTAIDAHTEGNPERIVTSGIPVIPGKTMLEKSKYARDNLDDVRRLLVHEPRGHANMYAALLVPPTVAEADFGVLYLEPGGYVTMCGHGTIAICTVLVETGMVAVQEPQTLIALDTPAGLVHAAVAVKNGRAESVTIRNVASFLYQPDTEVNVAGLGRLRMDIAYGGNFYAILDAEQVGLEIKPENANHFIALGTKIWQAVNEQVEIRHPDQTQIDCVNYVEFSGPPTHPRATLKNTVAVPPGGMDRSPCGTGTCAKMATLYAKGKLGLHEEFVHESIIGSLFYGQLDAETKVGDYSAVVPTIKGSAYVTGMHQFVVDPQDPFPTGFQLGELEKQYGFGFRD